MTKMILSQKELIQNELEDGTGAAISVAISAGGLRSGLKIWFADLQEKQGPVAELRPHGLRSHRVELTFGNFSGPILELIGQAKDEDIQLARALIASVGPSASLEIPGQTLSDWTIRNGSFRIIATIRHEAQLQDDLAVSATCREIIVPIMGAMAELIGYDVIQDDTQVNEEPAYEGAVLPTVVMRRERNPRNRLLCIRLHGEKCAACGVEPKLVYGLAGSIIEVHHLEPLASLEAPRAYDPKNDLVPLCPSCHRAVHTRRPVPLSLSEIKAAMEACGDSVG